MDLNLTKARESFMDGVLTTMDMIKDMGNICWEPFILRMLAGTFVDVDRMPLGASSTLITTSATIIQHLSHLETVKKASTALSSIKSLETI